MMLILSGLRFGSNFGHLIGAGPETPPGSKSNAVEAPGNCFQLADARASVRPANEIRLREVSLRKFLKNLRGVKRSFRRNGLSLPVLQVLSHTAMELKYARVMSDL
jgi:hypothetical protein